MWNRSNRLLPESRRGIGGSVPLHFRAAVLTRAVSRQTKTGPGLGLGSRPGPRLFGAAVPGQKRECLKDLFPQPPRIAVHRMPDPRLHRLIHRFLVDEPRMVVRVKPAEPSPETDHVRPRQPRVCG